MVRFVDAGRQSAPLLAFAMLLAASLAACAILSSTPEPSIAASSKSIEKKDSIISKVKKKVRKKVVAIDPGHSSRTSRGSEQIGPGSYSYKAKDNSGTAGRYTRVSEYKVTMKVALKLKKVLVKRGYKVVLTRKDNKTAVSCKRRAQIANRAKADIFVRLHCDGAYGSAMHGISMQSPGKKYKWARKNHRKVVRLSKCILRSTCKATRAFSRGIFYRNDLTGNNWAKMPVTLIEMGYMSNPTEDRKLVRDGYQRKLARGIANGIDRYFKFKR